MQAVPEFNCTGHLLLKAPARLIGEAGVHILDIIDRSMVWTCWLVVDMSAVVDIDAGGLRSLVRGKAHAAREGGDLVLAGIQPDLLRPSEMALIAQMFNVYRRLDELPPSPIRRLAPDLPTQRRQAQAQARQLA